MTQGYYVDEEVVEVREDAAGNKILHRKKTKRYIPPSITAIIYWLQNRRGDVWKTRASEHQNRKIQLDQKRLELDQEKQEDKW